MTFLSGMRRNLRKACSEYLSEDLEYHLTLKQITSDNMFENSYKKTERCV